MLRLWRVAPHCKVVNLVRSGRKQPQRTEQVPGERLATLILFVILSEAKDLLSRCRSPKQKQVPRRMRASG